MTMMIHHASLGAQQGRAPIPTHCCTLATATPYHPRPHPHNPPSTRCTNSTTGCCKMQVQERGCRPALALCYQRHGTNHHTGPGHSRPTPGGTIELYCRPAAHHLPTGPAPPLQPSLHLLQVAIDQPSQRGRKASNHNKWFNAGASALEECHQGPTTYGTRLLAPRGGKDCRGRHQGAAHNIPSVLRMATLMGTAVPPPPQLRHFM